MKLTIRFNVSMGCYVSSSTEERLFCQQEKKLLMLAAKCFNVIDSKTSLRHWKGILGYWNQTQLTFTVSVVDSLLPATALFLSVC